jgi:sugar phosphate isomerase/epimerase
VSGYRLAVCAEMVFLDLPFTGRVLRIADLGFEVEMWNWATKDIDALVKTGVTVSSMTGYLRGTLTDPAGADELLQTAQRSLQVAERLDCPRLNIHGTGLDDRGLPVIPTAVVTPAMWLTAPRTLTRLAELGERAGRVFTLENVNTAVDHPGTPFARPPPVPSPPRPPRRWRTRSAWPATVGLLAGRANPRAARYGSATLPGSFRGGRTAAWDVCTSVSRGMCSIIGMSAKSG